MGDKPVKTIITVVVIIIVLLCLELIIPASNPSNDCNFSNTVNITDGHRLQNGSYKFENVIYNEGMFKDYDFIMNNKRVKTTVNKHIRGCLCAIKPCIRTCKNYEDLDHITVNNEDEVEEKINLKDNTDYHIMAQRPCFKMFELDEDDDEWIMYKNGSIKLLDNGELIHSQHICFTNKTRADNKTIVSYCPIKKDEEKNEFIKKKTIVNNIVMSISIPFLLVTFFVYCWIPELRNVHGRSLMSYVGSLILLFLFLILADVYGSMGGGTFNCKFSGYGVYFFCILCFFWLNVMCYDIWSTFKGRMRGYRKLAENKSFAVFFAYALGFTILLTLILVFVDEVLDVSKDFKPSMGIRRCWISKNRKVEFLYVYLPISIISIANIILFSMTAYKIYMCQKEIASMRTEDSRKHSSIHADKDRFYLYLRLFIIMGVTWTMESVSWAFENTTYIFIITDVFNCLQGFIIFFLFVWKPKVIELVKKRWTSSSLNCCSKSRAELPVNTTCSEVTTKSSINDSEIRGKLTIDDS